MLHLHERLKKDLFSNLIAYLLLLSIKYHAGRSYGYQMKLFIEERLGEKVSEGTLYTLLPKLASPTKYGYLTAYIEDTGKNRKRRYYTLTERGEEELKNWIKTWDDAKIAIESVFTKITENGDN